MDKVYKIVTAFTLLFFLTSCKNSVTEQEEDIFSTPHLSEKNKAVCTQKELSNVLHHTYDHLSTDTPKCFSDTQANRILGLENKPQNSHESLNTIKKCDTLSSNTPPAEAQKDTLQLEGFSEEVNTSTYTQDIAVNNNLKEWLNTFSSMEEAIIDNQEPENNQDFSSVKNEASCSMQEISSSCLAPLVPGVIASECSNNPDNLADSFDVEISEEIPSIEDTASKSKLKQIGSALPTILYKRTASRSKRRQIGLSLPTTLLEFTIKDSMEANSFEDYILNQLKAEDWYKWAIGLNLDDDDRRSTAGNGVVVAVIDTGGDYTCPELSENIWTNTDEILDNGIDDDNNGYIDDIEGWNFVDNNNDPMDNDGHGTYATGIILKIVPSCKIMLLKALTGDGGNMIDICSAIEYAVDNGADVLNLSWGGNGESGLLKKSIDYAYDAGCVIVAAAGNSSGDIPLYPAIDPKTIPVTAGSMFGTITCFANHGGIIAPGKDIYIGEYISGTSVAAPFVSGVAAGLLSIDPSLHPMEVWYNLRHQISVNPTGFLNAHIIESQEPYIHYLGQEDENYIVRRMCRILSANEMEITVAAKGYVSCSLDYAEGINPGDKAVWKNITKIDNSSINSKILWDTKNLPSGIYTVQLRGILPNGNCEIPDIDRITVEINNGSSDNANIIHFLWYPFCTHNSHIKITNPCSNRIELTPVFYDRYGNELCSPLTAVIRGNGILDLKRYVPKGYQGPIGIEVTNYSQDIKILLDGKDKDFIEFNPEEKNILGALWTPKVPTKAERDNYLNSYNEWASKIDAPNKIDEYLDDMPKFLKEAKLVLCNPTNDDASTNITFYADGKLFDTGYKISDCPLWGIDDTGYDFYRSVGNEYRQTLCINQPSDNCPLEDQYSVRLIDYRFSFNSYSMVTKLGNALNEDGLYSIEWSSLIFGGSIGSIKIPARSFFSIPTWSFLNGPVPFDYFCANACMVTNIYPKGSVFGAVVIEKDGAAEEVIPLEPRLWE